MSAFALAAKAGTKGQAVPWLALSSSALAVLLSAGVLFAPDELALVRPELARGRFWLLWTGHLVHFNSAHLWGDVLAFAVWAALVEAASRRLLALTLLVGAPCLSLAILGLCPEVSHYRGLSALDCALVAELIGLRLGARGAPWLRGVALGGAGLFAAKCAYEFSIGHALLAPDLGPGTKLLPASHLLGLLLGVPLLASLPLRSSRLHDERGRPAAERKACPAARK